MDVHIMRSSFLLLSGLILMTLALLVFPPLSEATDQYAEQTGKGCIFCHQQSTGGQLKTVGFAFIKNGYKYPIPGRY